MFCPCCGAKALVLESRRNASGGRRRRIACQAEACGHRWTDWSGQRTLPLELNISRRPRGRKGKKKPEELSDADLRLVLERRDLSNVYMGGLLGRTAENIRQIRAGMTLAERLPEIPRWSRPEEKRSCTDCGHWRGHCTMGFPDPDLEGTGFATDCLVFRPASAAKSPAAAAR